MDGGHADKKDRVTGEINKLRANLGPEKFTQLEQLSA
jgi:hypothetical protein